MCNYVLVIVMTQVVGVVYTEPGVVSKLRSEVELVRHRLDQLNQQASYVLVHEVYYLKTVMHFITVLCNIMLAMQSTPATLEYLG